MTINAPLELKVRRDGVKVRILEVKMKEKIGKRVRVKDITDVDAIGDESVFLND